MRLERSKKKGEIEKEISDSKKEQGKRLENLKKVAKDKSIEARPKTSVQQFLGYALAG